MTIDLHTHSLVTLNAVSMYTNINTDHALIIISHFLCTSPLYSDLSTEPIIEALNIVMKNNIFQFGDTYWKQILGVAMGAPPACCIAMLYFYLKEKTLLPSFPSIIYYTRYIDDGFLIWKHHPNSNTDIKNFTAFKNSTAFGDLRWNVSPFAKKVNFLDITITFQHTQLRTNIFEKPSNLYTFLPKHSCHSPGVKKGTIIGLIKRAYSLISSHANVTAYICCSFLCFI